MSYKSEREIISTTDKLSAVAARLEPNTKYQFHVHAINGVKTFMNSSYHSLHGSVNLKLE